uniref:Uncharacterized LOC100175053 n=1 Tax=Ciona intestinalis TaxID=7719 RepID=F6ZZD5_CIOIN|nr:uncharacterized protein LOC100175053 [Ciona intestinalis]|eukprot:XP_002129623.1 uncharacterized protein LOC100175053 [Ciona intestinalis]
MTDVLICDPFNEKKVTKASKRNKQRKQAKNKHKGDDSPEPVSGNDSSLAGLRHQMELAQKQEDHVLMNKLRQKIWLLQDAAAGVKSNVSKETLAAIFQDTTNVKKTITFERPLNADVPTLEDTKREVLDKKMRKLQKKKQDIQKLKDRLGSGEKLEKTQLLKIERERELDDEIDDVEDELFQIQQQQRR